MKDKFEYFLTDNLSWKDEVENLKKLNVIYRSEWCHGFRVIQRKDTNPLIEMLCEDDGQLFSIGTKFDIFWAKSIIEALQETIKYCEDTGLFNYEKEYKEEEHE